MQFVITALDFTDSEALNRRIEQREAHLVGVRRMAAEGRFLSGGAMLDEQGRMIGSSLHMEMASRADLDDWLKNDPYVKGRVWEQIEVREIKLFPVSDYRK